ncbi:MAG: hypothetical protein ACM3UZ_04505 [Acidobacteriota bacterium]
MKKCDQCKKTFPEPTLKTMISILQRKAYIVHVCPNCQSIVLNNPNYYYLIEEEEETQG